SGFGEGQRFLGATAVTTDAQGNASFTLTPATPVPVGQLLSATASEFLLNNTSEFSAALAVTAPPPPVGGGSGVVELLAVGTGAGAAEVRVYNADGSLRFDLSPFPGFAGGVSVATGDVTGDGVEDVVVGSGPGSRPHVKVFDGATGTEVQSFFAF